MESAAVLLAQPHLCVIAGPLDAELARIRNALAHPVLVAGRRDLDALLAHLLAASSAAVAAGARTLDLIGHSTATTSLLQLGDWVVDGDAPEVVAWCEQLAHDQVLPRLGIRALRLLGCCTAETELGQRAVTRLAELLDVEVCGTTEMIGHTHYTPAGFDPAWRFLLASSTELARHSRERLLATIAPTPPPALALDALPALALDAHPPPCPRRFATHDDMRALLALVECDQGAPFGGMPITPSWEIAVPSARLEAFRFVQLVLDERFVRVYFDRFDRPGLLYPVRDPGAVRACIARLPAIPSAAPI